MDRMAGSAWRGVSRRAVLGGLAAGAVAPRARAEIVDLVVVGRESWLYPIWDEVRHVDLNRIARVTDTIAAAAEALTRSGIIVTFLLTPAKARIYRDFLPDDFRFSVDADRRYAAGLERLRKVGVVVPDMSAALTALRPQQQEPLWFKGDTHWTGVASQAAAVEMARRIKDAVEMPKSATPGTALGAPTTVQWEKNDLAALLPAAMSQKWPSETYKLRQPAASGGGGLLGGDDDVADIVVVGNSFMQPRLGFAPMLSNQLERPVNLVWKVHQVGPYQTLLSFLASASFRRKRPGLLVWNFHETDMTILPDARDGWGQNAIAPQAFLSSLRQSLGVA